MFSTEQTPWNGYINKFVGMQSQLGRSQLVKARPGRRLIKTFHWLKKHALLRKVCQHFTRTRVELEQPKHWATLNMAGYLSFFLPSPPILSGAYFKYLAMCSFIFVVVVSNELNTASDEKEKKKRSVLANANLSNILHISTCGIANVSTI